MSARAIDTPSIVDIVVTSATTTTRRKTLGRVECRSSCADIRRLPVSNGYKHGVGTAVDAYRGSTTCACEGGHIVLTRASRANARSTPRPHDLARSANAASSGVRVGCGERDRERRPEAEAARVSNDGAVLGTDEGPGDREAYAGSVAEVFVDAHEALEDA